MTGGAWTAFGILASMLLGMFFYLGNRIDKVIETLGKVDTRTQLIGEQLSTVEKRVDDVAARLKTVEGQVAMLISGGRIVNDEGTTGSQI